MWLPKNVIEPVDPRRRIKYLKTVLYFYVQVAKESLWVLLNRIANDIHPDVNIEGGDTVIFSSKIIPGNEKKLYALQNLIVKRY